MSRSTQHGFTLTELMITVVVVSILLGIAVPSYKQYVIRSKRTAAQAVMMDLANREQQFLLANRAYASKATLVANGFVPPADVAESYSWDVTLNADPDDPPSFTITFTGTGGQAADGALGLTSAGDKTPAGKW
jgi:type IV pilus assembly protein PilE